MIDMQDVLNKAIDLFGPDTQKLMFIEEAAELTVALMHERRKRTKGSSKEIIEEIADVSIMIEQLKIMYGVEAVNAAIESKVRRLNERMLF